MPSESARPHRRSFLKAAGSAAAFLSPVAFDPAKAANLQAESSQPGPIKGWITHGTQRFQPFTAAWRKNAGTGTPAIRIQPSIVKQEILGFGAAFTDASCYLFSQLAPEARTRLFADYFGRDGLRFNVCRTCIGASDYSRDAYSFDESPTPDPTLSRFSIEHDKSYILPALRDARKVNPDLFLFSSPWSPPGWMKPNNSMLGGSMRKEYFESYAQYFVKFLQAYAAEQVKIDAVTIQNEVDTDQNSRMPACLWGQEYEVEFIKSYLGPALQKAGLSTRIWIIDHNYNLWGRAIGELEDREAWKYIDGVAWHGYVGEAWGMTRVHEAFPEKHMYWTEGGPDYKESDYLTDWAKWSAAYATILRNWARCIVGWNLALDEQGRPNIGPFSCGGLITIDSKTKETTRSGQYWGFAHYSKVIERGARVIGSDGDIEGISHLALRNPDGKHVAVVTNSSDRAVKSTISLGQNKTEVDLPGHSVATLTW